VAQGIEHACLASVLPKKKKNAEQLKAFFFFLLQKQDLYIDRQKQNKNHIQ
jgi:hypothetical protein